MLVLVFNNLIQNKFELKNYTCSVLKIRLQPVHCLKIFVDPCRMKCCPTLQ